MSNYTTNILHIEKAPEESYKRENWMGYSNGLYVAIDTGYLYILMRHSVESIYRPEVLDLFKLQETDYEEKVNKSLLLEVVAATHGKFLE